MTTEPDLLHCAECGMPCEPGEYHPFAACLMFKASRNSTVVRANLRSVQRHATAARDAEIKALRAEVREAREFRDKMANAIGNDQLRRFIEKHGEPVPLTIRMQEAEAEVEALRAEVERLRAIAGCAYQMAGVHDAPEVWLDRLGQAANGDALPDPDTISDELLPYQPDAVCEAEARADKLRAEVATWEGLHASEVQVRQSWQVRAERLAEALRLIASPKRPDGTWNRDREACRQIAENALRDHDQEGK